MSMILTTVVQWNKKKYIKINDTYLEETRLKVLLFVGENYWKTRRFYFKWYVRCRSEVSTFNGCVFTKINKHCDTNVLLSQS